jgi:hypothetical protein
MRKRLATELFTHRSGEGVSHVPSISRNPRANNVRINIERLGPFRKGLLLTVYCYQMVSAGVAALLSWCRPPDIPRLITAVIVYAVKSVARRRSPSKTGKELFKRVEMKLDAATAIFGILRIVLVRAAIFGSEKGIIFRRASAPAPFAVGHQMVFPVASTGNIEFQGLLALNNKAATITATEPANTTPFGSTINRDNGQKSFPLAGKNFEIVRLGTNGSNGLLKSSTAIARIS